MLLNSTGVIAKSQREEESALLRRKVEELNKIVATQGRGTEQEYCPVDR